jgi:hypothetical protein
LNSFQCIGHFAQIFSFHEGHEGEGPNVTTHSDPNQCHELARNVNLGYIELRKRACMIVNTANCPNYSTGFYFQCRDPGILIPKLNFYEFAGKINELLETQNGHLYFAKMKHRIPTFIGIIANCNGSWICLRKLENGWL